MNMSYGFSFIRDSRNLENNLSERLDFRIFDPEKINMGNIIDYDRIFSLFFLLPYSESSLSPSQSYLSDIRILKRSYYILFWRSYINIDNYDRFGSPIRIRL